MLFPNMPILGSGSGDRVEFLGGAIFNLGLGLGFEPSLLIRISVELMVEASGSVEARRGVETGANRRGRLDRPKYFPK